MVFNKVNEGSFFFFLRISPIRIHLMALKTEGQVLSTIKMQSFRKRLGA